MGMGQSKTRRQTDKVFQADTRAPRVDLRRFRFVTASYMVRLEVVDNMRIEVYDQAMEARSAPQRTLGPSGSAPTGEEDATKQPDPLSEVRLAVDSILANWALRELLARRASKPTHA